MSLEARLLDYLIRKSRSRQEDLKLQAVASEGSESTRGRIVGAYREHAQWIEGLQELRQRLEGAGGEDRLEEMITKDSA